MIKLCYPFSIYYYINKNDMIKRIGLMLTFIMGTLFFANAQDSTRVHHKNPEQRAAKYSAALNKHLKLSDAQAKQVHTILLAQAKEMQDLKASNATASKKELHKKRKDILLATDKKISAV
jgi:hypothetical protein